jgi:beta-N-acetylhexosaminidase
LNRELDPLYPATLSEKILSGVLRGRLEFQGVIISDDMQMGAISRNYGFREALIRAVTAGCDIIAISNNGDRFDEGAVEKAHTILVDAVRSGRIPVSVISSAFRRILSLKRKSGILVSGMASRGFPRPDDNSPRAPWFAEQARMSAFRIGMGPS